MSAYQVTTWLPGPLVDGQRQPPTPCPELLTEDEAIRYLRLDTLGTDAKRSLQNLRLTDNLPAIPIGKKRLFFRRIDLDKFLEHRLKNKER